MFAVTAEICECHSVGMLLGLAVARGGGGKCEPRMLLRHCMPLPLPARLPQSAFSACSVFVSAVYLQVGHSMSLGPKGLAVAQGVLPAHVAAQALNVTSFATY